MAVQDCFLNEIQIDEIYEDRLPYYEDLDDNCWYEDDEDEE